MTEKQKETYLAWLNDAHAMELGLVKTLEKQIKDTEGMPEIQARLKSHLEETRDQAKKVEACIKRNGGDPSAGKDILSQMTAVVQGVAMSMPDDALIKNAHSSYAAEHFEIASYTVIIAAAEELGDMETANVCKQILAEEESMAEWLDEQLPVLVVDHLRAL